MRKLEFEAETLIKMYHDSVIKLAFDLKTQASPKAIKEAKEWHDILKIELLNRCNSKQN